MASARHSKTATASEQAPPSAVIAWRRSLLAACIILAPASITLYLVAWPGNGRHPLATAAMVSPTANTLHLIGAVAASFFLPLGYLGMSLLGMRRAPGLATVCAALSLIGWIPWAALIVLDDLAIAVNQAGGGAQLDALWTHVNGDPVMTTFLLIYIVGHLLSAVLIGLMLGRLRIIPVWTAWLFALSSPLTIALFPIHSSILVQNLLIYVICAFWFAGSIPAAYAMWKGTE